ncbi:MAG: hypothetical protein VCA57_10685 [Pseudomonas sp.]
MLSPTALPRVTQPAPLLLVRTWPRDSLLRRRRSVLFAFTFSPPSTSA